MYLPWHIYLNACHRSLHPDPFSPFYFLSLSLSLSNSHRQCDQIWQNSATLANILKSLVVYLRFIRFWSKFSAHFDTIYVLLGKLNGQILKTQSGYMVTLVTDSMLPQPPFSGGFRFLFLSCVQRTRWFDLISLSVLFAFLLFWCQTCATKAYAI